jgi:hypothetical protein
MISRADAIAAFGSAAIKKQRYAMAMQRYE